MVICPRCGKLSDFAAATCSACGQLLAATPQPPVLQPPVLHSQPIHHAPVQPMRAQNQAPFSSVGSLSQSAMESCLVCGFTYPLAQTRIGCPRCKAPRGHLSDPNDITSNRYIRFKGAAIPLTPERLYPAGEQENRLSGWNWGAAFSSIGWTARHGRWGWTFCCTLNCLFWSLIAIVIPPAVFSSTGASSDSNPEIELAIGLVFGSSALFWIIKTLYLGSRGNTMAMQSGLYPTEEEMRDSPKASGKKGAIVGIVLLVLLAIEFTWANMHG